MISQSGVLIRVPVNEISTFARPAKGVRVMRVGEGDAIVTLSAVPHEDEAEENTASDQAVDETAGDDTTGENQ